jgi:hypothetical protein
VQKIKDPCDLCESGQLHVHYLTCVIMHGTTKKQLLEEKVELAVDDLFARKRATGCTVAYIYMYRANLTLTVP